MHSLKKALDGHDLDIQDYRPGVKFRDFNKDLVILSGGGGEGQEITDTHQPGILWYSDEMKFIKSCEIPMIGICMGFEVMAKAYGQDVPKLSKLISGTTKLSTTKQGHKLFKKHNLQQIEAHRWFLQKSPDGFKTLAESESGVEVIHNPLRRQIASQFHPELGGDITLNRLIQQVI